MNIPAPIAMLAELTHRCPLSCPYCSNPMDFADITEVVAHIDHVVQIAGIDHVGLGSDFDGLGDTLPIGLKDVSDFPNLIYELLKKGYSEEDIQKICSGNLLRVWEKVEQIASEGNM